MTTFFKCYIVSCYFKWVYSESLVGSICQNKEHGKRQSKDR